MEKPKHAPIISLTDVNKSFKDKKILENVSFDIEPGDFVWLRGVSGAGKSTLLNLISGIEPATSGEIKILGKSLSDFKRSEWLNFYRKTIGYILQDFYLQNHLTVKENIELPGVFSNRTPRARRKRVKELAKTFDITDTLTRRPNELSGGQVERVCISRALFNHPKILLADEPTNNLDPENVDRLLDFFADINKNLGITIIISSHDRTVGRYASRELEIKNQKVSEA